ncbi:hypothetical protein [Delftia acidovorans]|uniref:hypothetical protein n=1 Tax=Delftia acidovorans TaxID=80866 RepID=UPI0012FD5B22|nr:hypothetical protein [Delftia acidovorans]
MSVLDFDETAWRAICQQCADIAIQGCGQSEIMFARSLFSPINTHLKNIDHSHHAQALKIAKEFGYLNAVELKADDDWNSSHGYCHHGIEMGYCPVGCD